MRFGRHTSRKNTYILPNRILPLQQGHSVSELPRSWNVFYKLYEGLFQRGQMTVAVAVIVAVLKESILSNPLLSLNSCLFILGLLATGLVGCGDPIDSELSFQEGGNEQSDFPSSASEGFNNGTSQSAESEGVSSDNILTFPSTENDSTEGGDPFNGNSSPGDENELPEFPEETEGGVRPRKKSNHSRNRLSLRRTKTRSKVRRIVTLTMNAPMERRKSVSPPCGSIGTRICSKEWGPCVPPLEICNGVDDDCDGTADINAVDSVMWYPDLDNDGSEMVNRVKRSVSPPSNWVDNGDDCNDEDSSLALDCSQSFRRLWTLWRLSLSTYKRECFPV